MKWKCNKNFIVDQVFGDYILVPIGERIERLGEISIINDLSAKILEMIKEGKTDTDMLNYIFDNYEVPSREQVELDFKEFIADMEAEGYIKEA